MADPELYNGGAVEGRGLPPPQKKIEFLPENGGFWCILGLLSTFMQKLVRSMGAAAPPPPPGSAAAWYQGGEPTQRNYQIPNRHVYTVFCSNTILNRSSLEAAEFKARYVYTF